MQPVEHSELERVKAQLVALQAWIRDLNTENAALRLRLLEQEPAADRKAAPLQAA